MSLKEKMHERMMTFFPTGGHNHNGENSTPVELTPGSVDVGHLTPALAALISGDGGDGSTVDDDGVVPVPDLVIQTPPVAPGGFTQGVVDWTTMCAVRFLRVLMTVDSECTVTFYHKGTFLDEDREFRATNCANKFLWEGAWIHYDEDDTKKVYYRIENTGSQSTSFQLTLKSGTMAANKHIDFLERLYAGGAELFGIVELVPGTGVSIEGDEETKKITISAGDVHTITTNRWALSPVKPAGYTSSVALTSNGGSVDLYMKDGYTTDSNRYVGFGENSQWIQVDMGAVKNVGAVQTIMYYIDGREYKDVRIDLSVDGTTWQPVKSPGNVWSTSEGFWVHIPKGILARYVRLYCNGSTANTGNHLVKLIPYALSDKE